MWMHHPQYRFRLSSDVGNLCPFALTQRHKRKIDILSDATPSKVLVTEEIMANQLNGLHLSRNYTSHGAHQEHQETATPSTSGMSQDFQNDVLPKLTLCDEIRALKDSFNILPKSLEPERPTNALILWQPPAGDLGRFLQLQMDKQKDRDDSDDADQDDSTVEEPKNVPDKWQPPSAELNIMDVELENNNTEMTCAYNGFSRAI